MKISIKACFVLPLLCLTTLAMGQEKPPETEAEYDAAYERRIRQSHLNQVYIPSDLADAFVQFNQLIDEPSKQKFKQVPEELAAKKLHFSLGRWISLNWSFYEGSRFSKYLQDLGLFHPDDMSRFVIITYHRNLNRVPLDVKPLIEQLTAAREQIEEEKRNKGTILHEETRIRPKN